MALPPQQSEQPANTGPNRKTRRHPDRAQRAYVGIDEAATYLDVTPKTVRRLIASEELAAYRLGKRLIKIRVADLESLLTPMHGGAA